MFMFYEIIIVRSERSRCWKPHDKWMARGWLSTSFVKTRGNILFFEKLTSSSQKYDLDVEFQV